MTIITIKEAAILHYIRRHPTSDVNVELIGRLGFEAKEIAKSLVSKSQSK